MAAKTTPILWHFLLLPLSLLPPIICLLYPHKTLTMLELSDVVYQKSGCFISRKGYLNPIVCMNSSRRGFLPPSLIFSSPSFSFKCSLRVAIVFSGIRGIWLDYLKRRETETRREWKKDLLRSNCGWVIVGGKTWHLAIMFEFYSRAIKKIKKKLDDILGRNRIDR